MKLSRAGVVTYLESHNLGLDSSARFDVRIPANEWAGLLQSILTAEPPAVEREESNVVTVSNDNDNYMKCGCRVLLLLETASVPGRLEVELAMPAPPAVKMQIGRGGSVRVESVRYMPAESLYVCRCCLVRFGDTPSLSTRAAVEEFIKSDTGLEWEQRETI